MIPLPPSFSFVCGEKDRDDSVYWIAYEYTVQTESTRNDLQSIPEAFFVWIDEDEFPGAAAVGGFVEAGEVAFAAGHDDGCVFVEGLDAAEV